MGQCGIFFRRCERIVEQLTPEMRSEVGSKEGNKQQLIVGTGEGRAQRKQRRKRRRDCRKWRRLECARQKIVRWINRCVWLKREREKRFTLVQKEVGKAIPGLFEWILQRRTNYDMASLAVACALIKWEAEILRASEK